MSNIIQNTPEWLEAKQSKISASEIFSLVLHYCRAELEKMGFDLKEERSFRTVQELFLKVKFGAKFSNIDPIHSEFGLGMEPYVAYRLNQELPQFRIERSKEFIINERLHPLAACSPDGYIQFPTFDRHAFGSSKFRIPDFDNTCDIDESWGEGALELKTANYFANFGSERGSRLNYIFQLQFQMMVMELKWGCLAVLMPKLKEYDDPFFKGRVLEKAERANPGNFSISGLEEFYDLKYYIYPELPAFQDLIMKSIANFQYDLDMYDIDQSRFPRNSEDLAGLQREKALWGQLWPNHYGTKELSANEELDRLLNERYQAQCESLFAEQNQKKIENEINQVLKQSGLEKFVEIKGTENRLLFIKNGQIRHYKLRSK
jgi:hypothetical protein